MPAAPPTPSPQAPLIVVVDDSSEDLRSLRDELARRFGPDFEVVARRSAGAAVVALEKSLARGREVALVIADMWMDEMTGVEFLARSRHIYPDARRALIWSYGDMRALEPLYRSMARAA